MISEQEARALLQEQKIERDIAETRSCAEIAVAMGLVSLKPEVSMQLSQPDEPFEV